MTPMFSAEHYAATHVGLVRSDNEDSYFASARDRVWLVADGMGGHSHGEFASQAIAAKLDGTHPPEAMEDACDAVVAAIHAANDEIFRRSIELGDQMGSTAVALVLRGAEFAVVWAGDSRAYLYRDGQLLRLTTDHTHVEAMLERGLLTLEDTHDHPMKHVLARAVGVQEDLEVDAIRDLVQSHDLFLLCSDGLHGVLSDEEITAILAAKGKAACDDLIAACLAGGAPDNVTIMLIAANDQTVLNPGDPNGGGLNGDGLRGDGLRGEGLNGEGAPT